ncbi:MAG: hypothetical protein WD708_00960 [Kiritimatiellia bacterium]
MESEHQSQWFVQSASGNRGPFSLTELMQQACTGKLNGNTKVSMDHGAGPWMKAETLEALELDWQVQPEEGPPLPRCHALALREGVENESIQPYWTILHLPSGETYDVVDALCSALLTQNRLLEEHIHAGSKPGTSPSDAEGEPDPMQQRISLDQAKKEAAKWQSLYQDEITRNEQQERKLREDVEELRAWQRNAAERIKAMDRRRIQEKEDGLSMSLPDGFSGDQDLARAYQELRVQLTHLLDSLELKSRQLDESRAQMKELTFQLRKERQQAQEQVEYVSQLHEDTLDQLNQLEQAHIHLTRSYRDLNDRTIRMRNEMKEEPRPPRPPAPASSPSPEKTDKPPASPPPPASDKGNKKEKGTVKLKMT